MTIKPTSAKPDTIEVWCTKYALTSGVTKTRGNVWDGSGNPKRLTFAQVTGCRGDTLIFHGHWHFTEALAIDRVKAMVAAKRKALVKQIEALNAIEAGLKIGKLPMADGVK